MQNHCSTMLGTRSTDVEFYSRVMVVAALCGVSVGLLFGIYHVFWGEALLSLILLPAVVLLLIASYSLKRNGSCQFSAWTVSLLQTFASTGIAFSVGPEASYWLFASAVANYYILNRRIAFSINMLACVLIAIFVLVDISYVARYMASFILVNVFLFSLARQLERKNEQLDRMLTVDPLTLAGNRTALDEALKRVKSQHDRHGVPVSLIMIDLDHFKRVNDTHGHAAGDKVLNRLATLIQNRLRPTDSLFRFGGEEFIVITENTHMDQAAYLAEDIRRRVENHTDEQHKRRIPVITVSLGLAQLRSNEAADHWMSRADQAMYRAKSMGRNWICFDADINADQLGRSSGASAL